MEIDWDKVDHEYAKSTGVFMNPSLVYAFQEYHRQAREQSCLHHHVLLQPGQLVETGTAIRGHYETHDSLTGHFPEPKPCDCDGRKKLEAVRMVWNELHNDIQCWYAKMRGQHVSLRLLACPLCDKPLP
jgi:hypothetical protein